MMGILNSIIEIKSLLHHSLKKQNKMTGEMKIHQNMYHCKNRIESVQMTKKN